MTHDLKHLFDPSGASALALALRSDPLLAFDFDGTLAPLVEHPDDARVPDALAHRLDRLATLRPLAIVTGRAVRDVAPRLGFAAAFIVGNHGAEDSGIAAQLDTAPFKSAPLDALRLRLAGHAAEFLDAGIWVEDKQYSLALHCRQARYPKVARARIAQLLAYPAPGLGSIPGKCVFNVVVTQSRDKCDAVASLVLRAGCQTAIFVGDDTNDEAVFVRAPAHWLTVRVGRDDPDSKAAYFLDGYDDIARLLDRMLSVLDPGRDGSP